MINKENEDKKPDDKPNDAGIIDVARMAVQGHILIKDKDTGKELVNKRG